MEIQINLITVGKRFRQDMGDVAGLAKSIRTHGLLHPVVVDSDRNLIAGQRRLEACKDLGWEKIPATVVDLSDPLAAERDENEHHKPFTVSEKVAMAKAIEDQEKQRAKERQREAGKNHGNGKQVASENFSEATCNGESGESAAKAAEAVGMSRPTYEKAKAVVDAAEAEPEKYSEAAEEMDKTGKVDPAFRKVQPFADKKRSRYKKKSERKNGRNGRQVFEKMKSLWNKLSKSDRAEFLAWAKKTTS